MFLNSPKYNSISSFTSLSDDEVTVKIGLPYVPFHFEDETLKQEIEEGISNQFKQK